MYDEELAVRQHLEIALGNVGEGHDFDGSNVRTSKQAVQRLCT